MTYQDIPCKPDLYTPKPYQVGFVMFLNVLNERQKMNDDR